MDAAESSSKKTNNASIPVEILFEIWAKLPPKSLMRFRCVSKFCNSLVFDPIFVDVHCTRPDRTRVLIFFPPQRHQILVSAAYTIDRVQENPKKLQISRVRGLDGDYFGGNWYKGFRFSANGLICLSDDEIFNVATAQRISPPRIIPNTNSFDSPQSSFDSTLLGYDSDLKTYKVVKFMNSCKHSILILSVDKAWRELKCCSFISPPSFLKGGYCPQRSVHIDGVIYTVLVRERSVVGSDVFIHAFDVGAETCSKIPFPESQSTLPPGNASLVEVDGQLAVVLIRRQIGVIHVWTFEKDMEWVKHTFTLQLEVDEMICQAYFMCSPTSGVWEIMVLIRGFSSFSMFFNEFGGQVWRKCEICGIDDVDDHLNGVKWEHIKMAHITEEIRFFPNNFE